MNKKKLNVPKKGAVRRLAQRLKEIGQRPPPSEWMEILNQTEETSVCSDKINLSNKSESDVEIR